MIDWLTIQELCEGGEDRLVNKDNVKEYVDRYRTAIIVSITLTILTIVVFITDTFPHSVGLKSVG